MAWQTLTLDQLRGINRDNVVALLRAGPMIPNSVLRVMADTSAGMAFLCLMYLAWQADQYLPDTAELDWLIRWANIKGVSIGLATFSTGQITVTGALEGTPVPQFAQLTASGSGSPTSGPQTIIFQTTAAATIGAGPTIIPVAALTAGQTGLEDGATLSFSNPGAGMVGTAVLTAFTDGDPGDDEDTIRANVLDVLREPPMGGDAHDYVQWARQYPGCTRAWCSPQEMGIGTVTIRFMMDKTNATSNPITNGFPSPADVAGMQTWIDSKRPVTVLDCFVVAPVPQPIDVQINNLITDFSGGSTVTSSTVDASTMANIVSALTSFLFLTGAPASSFNGVAIPAAPIAAVALSDAIFNAAGVEKFDFPTSDQPPISNASLAVLGNVQLG